MEDKKPLIFLNPLSESLTKLKEVMNESAEEDGIEIYEAESVEEMAQLLPNVGQSVVLTSNPKKCALMLQGNRKVIRALQSKVILLSPKAIPYRTLEKFMKIGLTECIVEPVAPKTLLYKVNLFVRSIATKKAGGEMNTKFGLDQKEEEEKEQSVKESKSSPDTVPEEEETLIEKKTRVEEVDEVDYRAKKKSNFEEAPIDGYYKGKTKKKDEELEGKEEERSGYKEEEIETYYKGDTKKSESVEEEEIPKRKKQQLSEEELLESLKQKVKLSVEEDISQEDKNKIAELEESIKKKKKAQLIVEATPEDKKKRTQGEAEDLGGHYKGKIAKKLNVEEDEEDFLDEDNSLEEIHAELKKKTRLEIENDLSVDDFIDTQETEEETLGKKPKVKLDVEIENEQADFVDKKEDEEKTKKDPKIKLNVEDESPLFKERQKKEEEEKKEKEAKITLNIQKDEEEKEQQAKIEDSEKASKKPKVKLNLENSNDELSEKESEQDEVKSNDKAAKTKLNIVDNEDKELKTKEQKEEEEKDHPRKGAIVNPTENEKKKKSGYQTDDLGGNMSRKSMDSIKDEKKDGHNKSDARADHIKTHYSSKESLKHNDDDWGNKWKKKEKEAEDFKKKPKENELIIEKKDLGEQTIDYKKLKEQFESISFDGISNKKKIYGEQKEKEAEIRVFEKTIYHDDGTSEVVMIEEVVEESEELKQKYYVPNPVGLDIATQILSFYLIKETKAKEILSHIGERVFKLYGAQSAFYFFNKTTGKYEESYALSEHSESIKGRDDFETLHEYWKLIKDSEFNSWQFVKLPFWSDTTFRKKEIQFVYPFFEGVQSMGFAVVTFQDGMTEDKTKTIEMIMETARGFYLDHFHELAGTRKNYGQKVAKKDESKDENKKGGMIKKLFGWAS